MPNIVQTSHAPSRHMSKRFIRFMLQLWNIAFCLNQDTSADIMNRVVEKYEDDLFKSRKAKEGTDGYNDACEQLKDYQWGLYYGDDLYTTNCLYLRYVVKGIVKDLLTWHTSDALSSKTR